MANPMAQVGSISNAGLSSILAFFDLWTRKALHDVLPLRTLNKFEAEFIIAAGSTLKADLSTLGATLTHDAGVLSLQPGNVPSAELVLLVEEQIKAHPFDQHTQAAQRVVEACVLVLREAAPHLSGEALTAAQCVTGHISGEDWMAPYEVCYEANGAGMQLTIPDFQNFTDTHRRITEEAQGRPTSRLLRDAWHWSCLIPCHEVVHLFQHVAGQTDSNPHSWSAEHDASIANAVLFTAVCNLPQMQDLLPVSFHWEVLMTDYTAQLAHYRSWDEPVRSEYSQWIASFGHSPPCSQISENSVVTEQFKGVAPYEYWSDQLADCHTVLGELLFPIGRVGDVYAHAVLDPDGSARRGAGALEALDAAVGEEKWADFTL